MGKMIRCPEGHFYDVEKHSACPWCESSAVASADTSPTGEAPQGSDPTRKLDEGGKAIPAPPNPPPGPSGGKTKRLDLTEQGVRPVVGWLVCVEGPEKGNDFRLHAEKNFIGRDGSMDVCIGRDHSVSRQKHAILTYEPKKGDFWLQPGESEGLVYLNDEVVNGPVSLEAYQVIEVGKTRLVMVPFDIEKFPLH